MTALPQAFPHGGGIAAAARRWQCKVTDILDLSTGLHPQGAPVWLDEWLKHHAEEVMHYPDAAQEPARTALAQDFSVSDDEVLLLAGAQAAIEVLPQAMGWSSLAIQTPCYNEPIRCALRAGCEIRAFAAGQNIPEADALWWTSPHNPTGIMNAMPPGMSGVWDESYMPFAQRRSMGVLPGVLRLGSLTKTFGIPGLRLGYAIAEKEVLARLNAWLPPWGVSTLALQLLPELLSEADARDAYLVQARQRMTKLLQRYGWQYTGSQASFVLAQPPESMPDFASQRILVRFFPEWESLQGRVRLGFPQQDRDWQRLEEALCPSV